MYKKNKNYFPYSKFINKDLKGNFKTTLLIDGIRCISCVEKIEKKLSQKYKIVSARINFTTGLLYISWSNSENNISNFISEIEKMGYAVKPYDNKNLNKKISKSEKDLLIYIAVSGFALGNLMMISIGLWSSNINFMGGATKGFFYIISNLIALPTIIFTARPFVYSAWNVLNKGEVNMDVPISMAILLTSLMSVYEVINDGDHVYFESTVMLIFFLLIGRYLDARSRSKAKGAAFDLLSAQNGTAKILKKGNVYTIPISDLRKNMIVLVATGEKIPVDGIVQKGISELDTSLITGETLPKLIKAGDDVFAGTTNLLAPIQVFVSKKIEDTLLNEMISLIENFEQKKSNYVNLANKVAGLYTPCIHLLSLTTFLSWFFFVGETWQMSLIYSITVLIITCPCALGLAVPVVQILASKRLLKEGILVKTGEALEKLSNINIAVFDKTGTLTVGKLLLKKNNLSNKDLQFAASLAVHSEHPLSKAIFSQYSGELLGVNNFKEIPGKGLQAFINNKLVKLGNRDWCQVKTKDSDVNLEVSLRVQNRQPVIFKFSDSLRENTFDLIEKLHKSKIDTKLLSGDRISVVASVANRLGIKSYHGELLPDEKCKVIQNLKRQDKNILMIGDGLNDAPALSISDVSVSLSSAVDFTQNVADVILKSKDISSIFTLWKVAKKTKTLTIQNLALALIYNLVAIPLAIFGYVTPLIAAIAMSSSSLIVIGNSFRMNRRLYK